MNITRKTALALIIIFFSALQIAPIVANTQNQQSTTAFKANLAWKTFLAPNPCCPGIVYGLTKWNNHYAVLVYFPGNDTTILYILNNIGNIIKIFKYEKYKPLYINITSSNYLDIIIYNTNDIKEFIYDIKNNLIPGFIIKLESYTILNGAIFNNGYYYIYGSELIPNSGLQGIILKISPAGVIRGQLVLNTTYPSSIVSLKIKEKEIYAAATISTKHPYSIIYIFDINLNKIKEEKLNNTIISFYINKYVYILLNSKILIFTNNMNKIEEKRISSDVIPIGITSAGNYVVVYGSFLDRENSIKYGLLIFLYNNTIIKNILISGRGNVTLTTVKSVGENSLLLGGVQNISPFTALLYYTQIMNQNASQNSTSLETGETRQNSEHTFSHLTYYLLLIIILLSILFVIINKKFL